MNNNDEEQISKIKRTMREMALEDVKRASEGGAKLGAIILGSCFIDYLAGFYANSGDNNEKRYTAFVKKFLPQYVPDELYKLLRCKLVHAYSAGDNYVFVKDKHDLHHKCDNDDRIIINTETFISDIEDAMNKYFKLLDNDEEVIKRAVNKVEEEPLIEIVRDEYTERLPDIGAITTNTFAASAAPSPIVDNCTLHDEPEDEEETDLIV